MRYLNLPLAKAFEHVQTRRPLIQPNDGYLMADYKRSCFYDFIRFMKQLVVYEKRIHGTESLKEGDWVVTGVVSPAQRNEAKNNSSGNREKLREFVKSAVTDEMLR